MSGPPGRQNTNNGVYIPPRRNIPPRAARGGTSAGAGTNPNLGNVTAGPPLPTDVIRSATVGPPVSNPMAPRMSAGGPSVNIPSRGASAQGFPDRSASVLVNSSRTSFVPPPRRNLPSATATPPYPPRPNLQMPVPLGGFAESVQYSPSYSQQAGGYPPNQPYPTQSTYENPYLPPTATFPEPQYQTFASTTSEYQRRPHSFHDDQQVQIPPRRETQRYSFSETSSLSSLDDEPSRIPPRHASENSIYSGGPVIPPRSSGFMIPMRNTSVLKRNIDTLLDEGGMAFAAPRHNVDEALLKWRQARELAVKETDLLREAKALSNIGCALRSQGLLQESLNELRDAWDVSTRYVEESASRANSLWLQLVMRHADIDSDIEAEDTVTSSRVSSSKTTQDGPDASQGPPIVVWFLQLTTNLGNAYLCLGQHQEAIQYHDMCRRLAEAILEEYPLPPGFNLPNLHRRASSASIATATTTANSEPADTSKPASEVGPSTKTKIKLSYLHRQTLLAQCRSLTHLGLCHQQLGLDDEALNTHTQAESIVTFYSARLLSSTSTRRASLSSPSAIPTEVYAAEAAIVANVGTAYHAKTSIPMALEYHERALKLFRNIDDELGRAKEEANIGCLLIEAGRICNSMQWIREMELLDQSAIHLEQCKRYWGPPRLETINMGLGLPDEETPEVIGQPLFDHGIMALYEVQKVLQGSSDWIGTMFIYANLAVGYVLLHQPYLALYYLSRCVTDSQLEHATGPTIPPNTFAPASPGSYKKGGVPPILYPQVYFTLCQALFLLSRLRQENPSRPLFPPPGPDGPGDHGTGLPVMDPEPINRLLRALDVPLSDVSALDDVTLMKVIEGCRHMLDSIMNQRTQAAAALFAAGSASLDVTRQKSITTSATNGKIAWVLASDRNATAEHFRTMYYEEGRNAFLRSVEEVARIVQISEATQSGKSTLTGGTSSTSTNAFYSSEKNVPSLAAALGASAPVAGSLVRNVLNLASRLDLNETEESNLTRTTVAPMLMALISDVLAFATEQRRDKKGGEPDLLQILGISGVSSTDQSQLVDIRQQLLSASRLIYGRALGLCETHALALIKAASERVARATALAQGQIPEDDLSEEEDMGFVGQLASSHLCANGVANGTTSSAGNMLPRIKKEENRFPCSHYKWNCRL